MNWLSLNLMIYPVQLVLQHEIQRDPQIEIQQDLLVVRVGIRGSHAVNRLG
jgi:hypothetical protein